MYRKFDKDVVFSGYNVPKGTVVFADFYITGRNPNYFEEPEKLKPERWLKKGGGHAYGSLPFSFGPRMCLGRRVAELELWVLMIKVILCQGKPEPSRSSCEFFRSVVSGVSTEYDTK